MKDTTPIELSRRRILGGLGAIGVASAGAGLGTSAYFNDQESFVGNNLEAGELDLYVAYEFTADQDGVEDDNLGEPRSGIVQGDVDEYEGDQVTVGYTLGDVKPGDSGTLKFCPRIVDNPAWLWATSDGVVDYENGQSEPEAAVDDSGGDPGEGDGELSENVLVTVSYCDEEGNTLRELNNPDGYSLADLSDDLVEGFLLDGDTDSDGTDPYPGSESSDDQAGPCICVDWEVPAAVGNEIQTDSVEFDVTFYAEQSRHNDEPENPFEDDGDDDGDV